MKIMTLLHLLTAVFLLTLLTGCESVTTEKSEVKADVPSPSEMAVDITVNGRTSNLNHIDIKHIGKTIPDTYSNGKISNSPGYDWWVSKHFAIKSDLPFEKVKLYLELLEMSYPHYVQLFGHEPANIHRQRIAVVYGSSREKLKSAMFDDGFLRGVHKNAGGETMYYNRAGYSFPSHREQHQRYIVIHETMHAFHMALNGHSTWAPIWITEGLADAIAHHVYDSINKQLTVMVFDRAPMNYVHLGLKQYKEAGFPSIEALNEQSKLYRGLNFFLIHYLLSTPELNHTFKLFVTRLLEANPHSENTKPVADHLLKSTFKNWRQLESGFKSFVESASSSFEIVNGPWEQDGNRFFIRDYEYTQNAQLNIELSIKNQNEPNRTHFDFPAPSAPKHLQTPAGTGVSFSIEYLPEHFDRGLNGIGFRRASLNKEASDVVQAVIVEGNKFRLSNGTEAFLNKDFALLPKLIEAAKHNNKLDVSLSLKDQKLEVKVHAGKEEQTILLSLNSENYTSLLHSNLALIAQNNSNRILPFFNETRAPQLQDIKPNANIWGIENSKQLSAAIQMCDEQRCQQVLDHIYQKINDQPKHADNMILQLYNDLSSGDAPTSKAYHPTSISLYHHGGQPFLNVVNLMDDADTTLEVKFYDVNKLAIASKQPELINARSSQAVDLSLPPNTTYIDWTLVNRRFPNRSQKAPLIPIKAFDGVELGVSSETDKRLNVQLSGPYSGPTSGTIKVRELFPGKPQSILQTIDVNIVPYEHKTFDIEISDNFEPGARIEVEAILDVDGEAIRLLKVLHRK